MTTTQDRNREILLKTPMAKCSTGFTNQLWDVTIWLRQMRSLFELVCPNDTSEELMIKYYFYLKLAGLSFPDSNDWYHSLLCFLQFDVDRGRAYMEKARSILEANTRGKRSVWYANLIARELETTN